MTDPASAEGLREALDSITTVEDRRPAHRGKVVTHYVDEVHSLDEPCRFCAALRDHSDSGDIAQRLDEAHARGFREGYRTAAARATPDRADPE